MIEPEISIRPEVPVGRPEPRLWIYLCVIVLSLVITGVIIDRNVASMAGVVRSITRFEEPTSAAAYEMEINVIGAGLGVTKYLATGNAAHRERVRDDTGDFGRYHAQFMSLARTPHEKEFGRRAADLFGEYAAVGATAMSLSDQERALSSQVARGFSRVDEIVDQEIKPQVDRATPQRQSFARSAEEIDAVMAETGSWLGNYLRTGRAEYRERVSRSIGEVRERLGPFRSLELAAAERKWAVEIEAVVGETVLLVEQILAINDSLLLNRKRFIELRNALDDLLDEDIQAQTADDLRAAETSALATVQALRWTNLGLCGAGLFVSLWAAVVILRRSRQLAVANSEQRGLIVELGQIESARAKLHEKLVVAEEEERRRLARELHDQMGQQLSAIVLGVKAIERALPPDALRAGELSARVAEVRELAENVVEKAHTIAWELRPAALDDLGLQSALTQYLERWSQRSGVAVDPLFHLDGERLPPHVETTLYRVAQEALTNVLKHAGAASVSVILEHRQGEARLVVEDDGRGFDMASAPTGRLGLLGMRERLTLAAGTLEVESRPGAGTTIVARIPVRTANGTC